MIFNLSTLELDNGRNNYSLQDLGLLILQRRNTNWLQQNRIGYNFEMYKKEKSRKSLTYRTLSLALQDGLGFKKMKSVEIFGNHKKLKNNKL